MPTLESFSIQMSYRMEVKGVVDHNCSVHDVVQSYTLKFQHSTWVPHPKYDMDACITTFFEGEACDLY